MSTAFLFAPALLAMTSTPAQPTDSNLALDPLTRFTTAPALVREDDDWGGGWYLRANAGLVTTEESSGPDEDIDFDEGYLLALAIGQRMSSGENPLNFDLELEGIWTDQDADDDGPIQAIQDITVAGALLNGMLDFRLGDRFSIYAGAGIGVAWLDVGTESDGVNDFNDEDGPFLAWQAKAGVMWRFTHNVGLTLGYRFLNIDDAEIDDDIGAADFDLETQQHIAEIGLRFGF